MEVLYRLSYRGIFFSWGREDSNLRRRSRQIYSLLPLAARAHPPSTPGDPRPETPGYGSKRHRLFNGARSAAEAALQHARFAGSQHAAPSSRARLSARVGLRPRSSAFQRALSLGSYPAAPRAHG